MGASLELRSADAAVNEPFPLSFIGQIEVNALGKRADDEEWEIVTADQCGAPGQVAATGNKFGGCGRLFGKMCASFSVGVNIGVAKCDFSFKTETCDSPPTKVVTVYAGQNANNVPANGAGAVQVTCSN